MRRHAVLVILLVTSVLSIQISGCTVLGLVIGGSLDRAASGRMRPGTQAQAVRIPTGTRVAVHFKDGRRLEGTYEGLSADVDPAYRARWQAWRETTGAVTRIPDLDEPVVLMEQRHDRIDGREVRGFFAGFGPQRVHLRLGRDAASPRGRTVAIPLGDALDMTFDSTGYFARDEVLTLATQAPLQTVLRLEGRHGVALWPLPSTDVDSIAFGVRDQTYRNLGLVLGVAADATLFLMVATLASTPPCGAPDLSGLFQSARLEPVQDLTLFTVAPPEATTEPAPHPATSPMTRPLAFR